MSKNDIDWSILKASIIFICSSVILCSVLIGVSYYFSSNMNKDLARNKTLFQSVSRRYLDVDQEEKLLHDYFPKFIKLYNQGIIGREKRLNWLEALRQSGENTMLPSLKYAINSQEVYKPGFKIDYNGYKLYSSSMNLNMGLLHEGDFFNVLRNLDKVAEGHYTITECNFRANGSEVKFDKKHTNITATCLLNWITINLPDGKEINI